MQTTCAILVLMNYKCGDNQWIDVTKISNAELRYVRIFPVITGVMSTKLYMLYYKYLAYSSYYSDTVVEHTKILVIWDTLPQTCDQLCCECYNQPQHYRVDNVDILVWDQSVTRVNIVCMYWCWDQGLWDDLGSWPGGCSGPGWLSQKC